MPFSRKSTYSVPGLQVNRTICLLPSSYRSDPREGYFFWNFDFAILLMPIVITTLKNQKCQSFIELTCKNCLAKSRFFAIIIWSNITLLSWNNNILRENDEGISYRDFELIFEITHFQSLSVPWMSNHTCCLCRAKPNELYDVERHYISRTFPYEEKEVGELLEHILFQKGFKQQL